MRRRRPAPRSERCADVDTPPESAVCGGVRRSCFQAMSGRSGRRHGTRGLTASLQAHRSETLEHAGVAERVGLDVREVEELGDTLVGTADELRVDVRVDDLLTDLRETAPGEESHLEREAEQ